MSIRLGLIGVEDNLKLIESVVNEFPEFQCLPFLHYYEKDVIELLTAHSNEVDMWLFSGIYPYTVAKKWGKASQPMFYVPYTGSSLYKTLYHILYHHQLDIKKLSFDALPELELKQVYHELDVHFTQNYLCEHYSSMEEVIEHHYQLWSTGETSAAITCAWQVQKELENLGVPVFRVTHTKSAIVSVLNMVLRTNEMLRFKDRQIAVQIFDIDAPSELSKSAFSSDEIYTIKIKNTQKLLKYAKRVQGSLKTIGSGRFVIFTTRGALSEVTNDFTIAPDIEQITTEAITCGIGIGQSAYDAEIRANNALANAMEYGIGNWIVAFEDKTFKGPLGKPESISYSYNGKNVQTISEQTSLSVSTINKIQSIIKKIGSIEMTAQDLAIHLNILPRSARRILTQLEMNGFAEEVGDENPYPRGRPRKLYRISITG